MNKNHLNTIFWRMYQNCNKRGIKVHCVKMVQKMTHQHVLRFLSISLIDQDRKSVASNNYGYRPFIWAQWISS